MKKKYQNIFFIFGLVVLAVMVSQLHFAEVWQGLQRAGYWFFAVVVLWAFLYLFNTAAWYTIIRSGERRGAASEAQENREHREAQEKRENQETREIQGYQENRGTQEASGTHVGFWWLYKITVSGFVGGEPYRIMVLKPKIGTERATASVLLYVMTHIFSHFWFWVLSIVLYVLTQELNTFMAIMLSLTGGFCALCIWFFLAGYRRGLAVRGMKLLGHIPGIKHWARRFIEGHREQLDNIVIIAFTTLFANMLFFMPLQLGGREGGFLMSVSGLGLTATAGIFVALLVRIRELIWTAIGLLLIKLDRTSLREKPTEKPPCP